MTPKQREQLKVIGIHFDAGGYEYLLMRDINFIQRLQREGGNTELSRHQSARLTKIYNTLQQ